MRSATKILCLIGAVILRSGNTSGATAKKKSTKKKTFDTSKYSKICGTAFNENGHKLFSRIVKTSRHPTTTIFSMEDNASPQHKAICWLAHVDKSKPKFNDSNLIQRYSLLVFYFATNGDKWFNKKQRWTSAEHECKWFGIKCNQSKRVIEIGMGFNNIGGVIPREIGDLTNIKILDLHGNELTSVIPIRITELKRLEVLMLHMNGLFGALSNEFGELTNLRELYLYGNYLGGKLPKEIGNLSNLGKVVFKLLFIQILSPH